MKKFAIISTIVLGLATTSCDNYLDINQDPNSPSESMMTADIMMPAAEMNLAGSYGVCIVVFLAAILHSIMYRLSVHQTIWTIVSSKCRLLVLARSTGS